jgi:hypothetical protein
MSDSKAVSPPLPEAVREQVAGRFDRTLVDFERACLVHLDEEQLPLAGLPTPPPTPEDWQPIETAPKGAELWFWVRPLTAEETYTDTSGKPILSTGKPHLHRGTRGSWGSLFTATHWQPIREPGPPTPEDR